MNKICCMCNKEYDLVFFHKCSSSKDGRHSYCIYCRRTWANRYASRYVKKYRHQQRADLIKAMGGKCVRCGFSDIRALQIDHINGGGSKELKSVCTYSYYKLIAEDIKLGGNKYQVLCANCNWIKRSERSEVGKGRVKLLP